MIPESEGIEYGNFVNFIRNKPLYDWFKSE